MMNCLFERVPTNHSPAKKAMENFGGPIASIADAAAPASHAVSFMFIISTRRRGNMNNRPRSRAIAAVLVFVVSSLPRDAAACLRDSPDARAIQWSTVIVEAKLTAVDEPVELTRLKQAEPGQAE